MKTWIFCTFFDVFGRAIEYLRIDKIITKLLCKLFSPLTFYDKGIIETNKKSIKSVYELLDDKESKFIYEKIILKRFNENSMFFSSIKSKSEQYFPDFILQRGFDINIIVDAGAYIGDTIDRFLYYWSNTITSIYAFEVDKKNLEKIENKYYKTPQVHIIPKALHVENTILEFTGTNENIHAMENFQNNNLFHNAFKIEAVRLDDEIDHNKKVDYIKMDIEGSELDALRGSTETLRTHKPMLAISIYHKPEHLWEIPLYIKSIVPEYKFRIRHHHSTWNDTVLYCYIEN